MEPVSQVLTSIRQTMKLYDRCLDKVRQQYGLSKLEAIIISFLHSDPGHDTVGAIADMRMLSKGNVSRGVDSLVERGVLERVSDSADRRWVHLRLKPEAEPIARDLAAASVAFRQLVFEGFTPEELEWFRVLNRKLDRNICKDLERSIPLHGE